MFIEIPSVLAKFVYSVFPDKDFFWSLSLFPQCTGDPAKVGGGGLGEKLPSIFVHLDFPLKMV